VAHTWRSPSACVHEVIPGTSMPSEKNITSAPSTRNEGKNSLMDRRRLLQKKVALTPNSLAAAARHNLQRYGDAAPQAVHGLHVAAPHIGQQLAEHGLRGRKRNVDLGTVHQVGIAAPVDQRQHATRTHALG
jgi:hypothetical protein